MQQIEREQFDLVWNAVETLSTNEATRFAVDNGVQPPTGDHGWVVTAYFSPEGEVGLVWSRARRVVIDSEGFVYRGPMPGPTAMQVNRDVYDRIIVAVEGLDDAEAIAEVVRAQGVESPDDSDGWEIYFDSVNGRDGERLVWYRDEVVPIERRRDDG